MESICNDTICQTISKHFKKYLSNPENLESAANSLVEDLIEDAIMSVVFEVDIERKLKINDIIKGDNESEVFQFKDVPLGLDIFGQSITEKFADCPCPCCNRSIAAARFAPHLAKCMGMGRNSSRIARSRIASNANKEIGGSSVGAVSDDDDDADWSIIPEKKGKTKKKEKSASKRLKTSKQAKNGNQSESSYPNISFENMTERERKTLLSQICGVISDHTKKVCTKSTKCPQHSEDQKKAVRDLYLMDNVEQFSIDNLQIDVDTCEDEEELAKDSLVRSWEAEHSNTSSPADSASTSSSSSKKRDKSSMKKKD